MISTNIPRSAGAHGAHARASCVGWVTLFAASGWAVAWVACDRLHLAREAFLVPYLAATALLVASFVARSGVPVRERLGRHPWRALAVTALAMAVVVRSVLLQPGASPAHGLRLAFELAWDGVAYGAADGLLLTVLPMTAVRDAFAAAARTASARAGVAALATLASLVVFAAYHLGFPEFQGPLLVWPLVAGAVFAVTYVVADEPLAPIVAHAVMHVAAVLHGPAGTLQLPPHY